MPDPLDALAAADRSAALPYGDRGAIQTIDRAAMILALFDQNTQVLSPTLVADRLGLNRTTAHRYLQSLQASGFLGQGYGPGPLINQLASLVSARQQILTVAPAIMRTLADQTGLTAVLSFLGRSGAVVSHVEEANGGTILLTVRVGTVLELKAAQSRMLLAFQSDPEVASRMHASLDGAEARKEQAELALARRNRVAWADLGRVGLASVAAPVFGSRDIQAAVAVLGTTTMLSPSDLSSPRVELLRDAAERISSTVTI
ncbi:helix-turn-helix domain-containing protein [Arthrobacter zhangbolii]|uniref:Helix-turn-helix domain-containing protein n=1 Tax=Arthrobacter zhangbolii TaxID=2886936 RepID=A0A9X1MAH1_9MICC|nr:helix-turn-helix domain-containing protein [Arthrobacter zhangbolii]MCC3273547.1 helix-turn-helix domain-containing protein [Arthrobacter zhangbolii]UON92360.1 helix-turn-helix domain-containing protein [Arthrobacter zhangbolii]